MLISALLIFRNYTLVGVVWLYSILDVKCRGRGGMAPGTTSFFIWSTLRITCRIYLDVKGASSMWAPVPLQPQSISSLGVWTSGGTSERRPGQGRRIQLAETYVASSAEMSSFRWHLGLYVSFGPCPGIYLPECLSLLAPAVERTSSSSTVVRSRSRRPDVVVDLTSSSILSRCLALLVFGCTRATRFESSLESSYEYFLGRLSRDVSFSPAILIFLN
jgi:hypothetical protein